jgi:hypothetical protein
MTAQLPLGFESPTAPRSSGLRSFHANASTTVDEALAGEARAKAQDDRVLSWFGWVGGARFTASEVHTALGGDAGFGPLTSLRRSLTGLAKAGKLQHHRADRRPGPRGARETTWSRA